MREFLLKIYLFRFLDDLVLIYPLYTVMFSDFHVTPIQISILLAVWAGTSLILEIPSGVLADKYSRKNLLFIGQIIRTIGYVIWIIFPTFWGFLIGFVLWGIKSAFTSGTLQAVIYDELKANNNEKEYTKIIGMTKTLSFIAILLASLLSSVAIPYGYTFVLIVSCIATSLSALIIFLLPNVKKIESTYEKEYFTILKQGVKDAFSSKAIVFIMIFLSLAYALGGALDEYWTLFANNAGLALEKLGILLALMSLSQSIASYFAHKFEKLPNYFFFFLFGLSGILLFFSAYIYTIPSLVLLVIFSFLFTIIHVVFDGRLQHTIPKETRATVSSVNGFLIEIGAILVFLIVGIFTQISSLRDVFGGFGILILGISILYTLFEYRKIINK
ncbi:MAG: MFS transporter [bacterium]